MDAATDYKIEIGCTMNVTDERWNSIFGTKEDKEETKEVEEND